MSTLVARPRHHKGYLARLDHTKLCQASANEISGKHTHPVEEQQMHMKIIEHVNDTYRNFCQPA